MLNSLIRQYATTRVLGIDVGSAAIKVAEVERDGQRLVLRRCAVATIENGAVASALKHLIASLDLGSQKASIGLASPEVVVKPFEFPPMPRKELQSAIQLEAESATLNGHTPEEMATDWHLLRGGSKETQRGVMAVVPKTVLESRLRLAKQAGLRPAVADVEGLALWNAFWALNAGQAAGKTILLANIGARTTNLVIATGPDRLHLVRDVQLGATALADGLGQDWVSEVRDSLAYARGNGGLRGIDAAHVSGGGASPEAVTLLRSAVSAPVELWNPLTQIARESNRVGVEESAGPLFAIAIGLAIRQPS